MTKVPDRHLWLVAVCALLSVVYVLPSLIGLVSHGAAASRLVTINLLLGWTVIGWTWAFALACRSRRPGSAVTLASAEWVPWLPGRPEAADLAVGAPGTYADGTYLISERGAARTWAVCRDGRWGIAYELDGIQRTAGWVDSSDIPIGVLAHALEPCPPTKGHA